MNPEEGARMVLSFANRMGGKQLRKAAINAANRGMAHMVPLTPADTAFLRTAWHVVPKANGAELRNDAPYAAIVERGRRPGSWPPWEPIVRYVARKLQVNLSGADLSQYGQISGGGSSPEAIEEVRNFAYGLCAKIANKGIAPTYFTRKQVPKLRQFFLEEIVRVLMEKQGGATT